MRTLATLTSLIAIGVACGARVETPAEGDGGAGATGGDGAGGAERPGGGEPGVGAAGAGGETVELPTPTNLFVSNEGCAVEARLEETTEAFDLESADGAYAAELYFVDECSGAGGQYILARALDGSREDWLGGHTCYFFPFEWGTTGAYGVVHYVQTAGLFQTPEGWCVSWPDGIEPLTTDGMTRAIALFETIDEAQHFADAVSP